MSAALNQSASQHQANYGNRKHHKAEIAPAIGARQLTNDNADNHEGQSNPIGPAKQRYLGWNDDDQRKQADEDRDNVQHAL